MIQIKSGKEKALKHHHPWIFSGAIIQPKEQPALGSIVKVTDAENRFLAWGYYNAQSKISVRVLDWNETAVINSSWWKNKLEQIIKRREHLFKNTNTDSFRLIFSEADGIPGLIVDKYADFLVMQVLTAGIEVQKALIADILFELLKPKGIYERSDANARSLEALTTSNGLLKGDMPPEYLTIKENDIHFKVNIADGQKSGYFLDQRENRKKTGILTKGLNVLDCFCYTGGFSLNALLAGAKSVIGIDSSAAAIETVKQNFEANSISFSPDNFIQADVNTALRKFQREGKTFDFIILDPPKLAPSRSALDKALRAYKDLNIQALKILPSGGLLATFSCSGAVELGLLKQAVAWAALDAGKEVQFIDQFTQPEDHPVLASFPESEYLKGLLCRVL